MSDSTISTLLDPNPAVSAIVPDEPKSDVMISVRNLGKLYRLYDHPQDRLKEQLLWRFGKHFGRSFWALQDISFEIRKGETVGIIGRNGSGKSTLLQIIAGTLSPATGEARVAGRVAALLELGSGFNFEFTGRENVFLNGTVLGISGEEMAERFEEIAAFADIGEFIDQPVKLYSSGMMMRLAFAVAACVEPDVLIVDEALAVGDMAFQQKCFARIEEVKHRGTTILFVSHDIYMVRTYCERAIYLQSGRKIMDGSAENVTEAYLKDVIAERQARTPASIMWKANPRVGVAGFGGDLGEIVSAEFLSRDRGPSITAVTYGDEIGLRVKARIDRQVRNPALFCQIRDYGGYAISGINSSLMGIQFSDQEREDGEIGWIVWWPVVLSPGPYTFTLGLNDYIGQTVNVVIDKQVGVCPFTVLDSQMHFHGAADLKAQLEKADPYATLDDLRTSRRKIMERTRVEAHELRQISERYFGWQTNQFSRWWEYPWVANQIVPQLGMYVLDAGAGKSPLPFFCAERGALTYTVDNGLPDEPAEWGSFDYSRVVPAITSLNMDFSRLDWARAEQFDCIYSVSVMEHVPAEVRQRAWHEFARVLNADGKLVLTLDLCADGVSLWNRSRGLEVESPAEHGTIDTMLQELREAGFLLTTYELCPLVSEQARVAGLVLTKTQG